MRASAAQPGRFPRGFPVDTARGPGISPVGGGGIGVHGTRATLAPRRGPCMRFRIAQIILLIAGVAGPATAADELVQLDHAVIDKRLFTIMRPSVGERCEKPDFGAIPANRVKRAEQVIVAESFNPPVGYVYWISNANGPHEVYYATFVLRGCVVVERRYEEKQFDGPKKQEDAKSYYLTLLKGRLN